MPHHYVMLRCKQDVMSSVAKKNSYMTVYNGGIQGGA